MQTPAEVVADPQLLANDGFVEVEGGAVRSVNGPITFSGVAGNPLMGTPRSVITPRRYSRNCPDG
jgi:crotonobetainyl-CoA:carnitine CoA-transferase CaiB-like acyl-CoA transferase